MSSSSSSSLGISRWYISSLCDELEKMPLLTFWSTFLGDDDEWIIASSKQCISPGFAYVGAVGKFQL
jgi:hypothetical protein